MDAAMMARTERLAADARRAQQEMLAQPTPDTIGSANTLRESDVRRALMAEIDRVKKEVQSLEETINSSESSLRERPSSSSSAADLEDLLRKLAAKGDEHFLRAVDEYGQELHRGEGSDAEDAEDEAPWKSSDMLQQLSTLQNLTFHSSNNFMCDYGEKRRRFIFIGTAGTAIPFRLRFEVDEIQRCVDELHVDVPDDTRAQLGAFLDRAVRENSVRAVLRGLAGYAAAREARAGVLQRIASALDGRCSISHEVLGAATIEFAPESDAALSVSIRWRIDVDADGAVEQHIALLPQYHGEDERVVAALRAFPAQFDSLVRICGVEGALLKIANAVA